jgi:hypothetical protein
MDKESDSSCLNFGWPLGCGSCRLSYLSQHSWFVCSIQYDQAVLLTNGSVYFGHLQYYGSSHPVLTDVFYVVSQTDPETKQVKSSLIKRGKEMHEARLFLWRRWEQTQESLSSLPRHRTNLCLEKCGRDQPTQ